MLCLVLFPVYVLLPVLLVLILVVLLLPCSSVHINVLLHVLVDC